MTYQITSNLVCFPFFLGARSLKEKYILTSKSYRALGAFNVAVSG